MQPKSMIPRSAVTRHLATIKAHLANAAQALRVADAKLGQAADENNHVHDYLDTEILLEAQMGARVFADMLDDDTGIPSLPAEVFRTIANYANQGEPHETPHVQGAVLALTLADRSLSALLDLAVIDGLPIEQPYQLPFAARGMVRNYLIAFTSHAFVFDHDAVLDAILAGKQRPAVARKRRLAAA